MPEQTSFGTVAWTDLTIPNAEEVAQFYRAVVGWNIQRTEMGDYADFTMLQADGEPAAGVCHAKGPNIGIPPVWMIYVTVPSLSEALQKCLDLGGRQLGEVRGSSEMGFYCPIQDPAGACLMLFEPLADLSE